MAKIKLMSSAHLKQSFLGAGLLLLCAILLSGCGSAGNAGFRILGGGSPDGLKIGGSGSGPDIELPIGSICPKAEIRPGAETMRYYKGEPSANNVRLQTHIDGVIRECQTVGNQTLVNLTLSGRATIGPKASGSSQGNTIIQVTVIDKEGQPITSVNHNQPITLGNSAMPVTTFLTTLPPLAINEITPRTLSGYTVYVGFDTGKK